VHYNEGVRVLGVDYGRRKTGVAVCEGKLAEPLAVVREGREKLIKKLGEIVEGQEVETVVVGVSEGQMGEEQKAFGLNLAIERGGEVEFEDETLTTKEVQQLTREAGMKRKRRRELEDAFAATLILQRWVDRQKEK